MYTNQIYVYGMVHVDPACIESKITDISNREAEEITQYLRTNYLNEIKT